MPAQVNGASNGAPVQSEAEVAQHRAEVEGELQRILNEAGVHAELEGILMDARHEAERHGIALDPELIMQALCEEINGSAKLSDPKRAELRAMFAEIAAEEASTFPPRPKPSQRSNPAVLTDTGRARLDFPARQAGVVKLVDTRRSGRRGRKPMGVRVPPPASRMARIATAARSSSLA